MNSRSEANHHAITTSRSYKHTLPQEARSHHRTLPLHSNSQLRRDLLQTLDGGQQDMGRSLRTFWHNIITLFQQIP